jgi:hypothetical protein
MTYYHYTSQQAAQDIICSGYIRPSPRNGLIYLSPDLYTSGFQAANALGIENKPVMIRFDVPEDLVDSPTAPVHAKRILGPEGVRRQGGGWEITTSSPIPISSNPSHWFVLAPP